MYPGAPSPNPDTMTKFLGHQLVADESLGEHDQELTSPRMELSCWAKPSLGAIDEAQGEALVLCSLEE